MLGVVVLDFSADATEGPIRAYLLDVVDSEEQDMALNIHAFSAGESAPLPRQGRRGCAPGQRPRSGWASTSGARSWGPVTVGRAVGAGLASWPLCCSLPVGGQLSHLRGTSPS